MKKKQIGTIFEKNFIIGNILQTLNDKDNFLILGHKNPDEDCVSSMISFALLVSKFSKEASIYISESIHEHFQYLLNICTYNAINLLTSESELNESFDVIAVCDTPKPSMVDCPAALEKLLHDKDIIKIEIDHHIGADSKYIGDEGYRLVTEASSASELVGLVALKLRNRSDLLEKFHIVNPLSRNLILSILTGIVGDTNMGQYIKSRKEKRYYEIFSNLYNTLLARETTKSTNFTDKSEVFREIRRLSTEEEDCFNYMNKRKKFSSSIGFVVLDKNDMDTINRRFDNDTLVSVSRTIADSLAEESSRLGFVVYDDAKQSGLVQFRIRRAQRFKGFDLRQILEIFGIDNGGGHEGAIGFRVDSGSLDDIHGYVDFLISGIEKALVA